MDELIQRVEVMRQWELTIAPKTRDELLIVTLIRHRVSV